MPTKSWCNICETEMSRMYLRKQDVFKRRTFVAIGWYYDKCRVFQAYEKDIEEALELILRRRLLGYRIYLRGILKARQFIPFAHYYPSVGFFELDETRNNRIVRMINMLPEEMKKQLEAVPKNE